MSNERPAVKDLTSLPVEIKTRIAQFVGQDPESPLYRKAPLAPLRLVDTVWNDIVEPLFYESHFTVMIVPMLEEDAYWSKFCKYMRFAVFPVGIPKRLLESIDTRNGKSLDVVLAKMIKDCHQLEAIQVVYKTCLKGAQNTSITLNLSLLAICAKTTITSLSIPNSCSAAESVAAQMLSAMPQVTHFAFGGQPRSEHAEMTGGWNVSGSANAFTSALFSMQNLQDLDITGYCVGPIERVQHLRMGLSSLTAPVQMLGSTAGDLIYCSRDTLQIGVLDAHALSRAKGIAGGQLCLPQLLKLHVIQGLFPVSSIADAMPEAENLQRLSFSSMEDDAALLVDIIASRRYPKLQILNLAQPMMSAGVVELSEACKKAGVAFYAHKADLEDDENPLDHLALMDSEPDSNDADVQLNSDGTANLDQLQSLAL